MRTLDQRAERGPRALLIDDDPVARRLIADALLSRGIETVLAADGLEGMRVLTDELFALDALVTDVVMPSLCGESIVRVIRQLGGELDLPIVVVSGAMDAARAARLRSAGADVLVDKREGPGAVADAVCRTVAQRRALEAAAA